MVVLLLASPSGRVEALRVVQGLLIPRSDGLAVTKGWRVPRFFLLLSVTLLIVATVHPGFDGDATFSRAVELTCDVSPLGYILKPEHRE